MTLCSNKLFSKKKKYFNIFLPQNTTNITQISCDSLLGLCYVILIPLHFFQVLFSHKPIKYTPKEFSNKLRLYMLRNIFQKQFRILLWSYKIKTSRACIYPVSLKHSIRYFKYLFKTESEPRSLQAAVQTLKKTCYSKLSLLPPSSCLLLVS
jgi:hypothetical protein